MRYIKSYLFLPLLTLYSCAITEKINGENISTVISARPRVRYRRASAPPGIVLIRLVDVHSLARFESSHRSGVQSERDRRCETHDNGVSQRGKQLVFIIRPSLL